MSSIYSLNEFTALPFAVSALVGRKPYVLGVNPAVSRLAPRLKKLAGALMASGKARDIRGLVPEYTPELDYDQRVHFHDVFAAIEPWQAEYYDFERAGKQMPVYARALRHANSLYLSQMLASILILPAVLRALAPSGRVFGVFPDIAEAVSVFAKSERDPRIKTSWISKWLINAVFMVLALTTTVFWALGRIRPFKKPPKEIFFAADYISDSSDENLYGEIEDGGDILIVARTPADAERFNKTGRNFTVCAPTDGVLGPIEAVILICRLVKECLGFYLLHGGKTPALFFRLISLPRRRAEYQALFNRFRPHVFWGRDTYDPRHILRRSELNRCGGESWGVCHSYLTYGTSYPEFRHIAFDRYYVLGKGFYDYYCRETWNSDVQVIETGSFRASREIFRIRLQEKPEDILVLCSSFIMEPGLVELVRTLAEKFPKRSVYLQVKITFINTEAGKTFIEACAHGLPNVLLVTGDLYSLFAKARYVFSDPSTAVIEATQFGNYTLATDISPTRKPSILREIPQFCVTSGEQAAQRIKDLESGEWRYPIEEIGKFVDLSGQAFCDRLRRDLGLPEGERPQSAWTGSEIMPITQEKLIPS